LALGDSLRRLDRWLLPPIARALLRVGHGPVRLRALSTVALFCAVVGAVTAAWAVDRPATGELTLPQMAVVGVLEGEPVAGYLAAADAELARLAADTGPGSDEPTYALVTFSAYLGADRLRSVLGEVPVAEAFARVNLPGREAANLRLRALRDAGDLTPAMREAAARRQREAAGYRARAGTERAAGQRRTYEQQAVAAEAEALAYRSGCSCVYAVVIRATPRLLQDIAGRAAVRAVDPAPEVWNLDRAVFSPPLPEQTDRAAAQRGREPRAGKRSDPPAGEPGRRPDPIPSSSAGTPGPAHSPPTAPTRSAVPDESVSPGGPVTPEVPPATPDGVDDTPQPLPTAGQESAPPG